MSLLHTVIIVEVNQRYQLFTIGGNFDPNTIKSKEVVQRRRQLS